MKFNYFKIKNLVKIHKQIEIKDGLTYMRAKKRPLLLVSQLG
jgi:hypothetical protein